MKRDTHKLGVWLEKVCQEGIALEQKILEWKSGEQKEAVSRTPAAFARLITSGERLSYRMRRSYSITRLRLGMSA
jgi:hypothetical protein